MVATAIKCLYAYKEAEFSVSIAFGERNKVNMQQEQKNRTLSLSPLSFRLSLELFVRLFTQVCRTVLTQQQHLHPDAKTKLENKLKKCLLCFVHFLNKSQIKLKYHSGQKYALFLFFHLQSCTHTQYAHAGCFIHT